MGFGTGRLGIAVNPLAAGLSVSSTFRSGGPTVAARSFFFASAAAGSMGMPPEDFGGGGAPAGTAFAMIPPGPLWGSAVALLGAFSWLGAGSRSCGNAAGGTY